MRKVIIAENKGKSGIYMFTNKITGDIYVGQSIDISNRFKHYFNISYLKSKDGLRITRAILKYGYSNFSITILEYCDISDLLEREQYYFKLEPQYNILKIAGSSLPPPHSPPSNLISPPSYLIWGRPGRLRLGLLRWWIWGRRKACGGGGFNH